jgi:hypothetical protein
MGLGVDAELRPVASQRLGLKMGGLWLYNADAARSGGPAAEASYGYTSKPATVNLRWRQMPPTVRGLSIFGDDMTGDASLRLGGEVRLVGYAYHTVADTVGGDFASEGSGGSFGVRLGRRTRRLEVRANYRETEFSMRQLRRTVSIGFGTPVGPLTLSGSADLGRQETGWRAGPVAFYRADLRWIRNDSSATLTASHSEGSGVRRQRVDFMMSLKVQALEMAGGAWATRGYTSGGWPGAWTSIGIPIGGGRSVTVGVDYSSRTWTGPPSLRGMVAIRQGFTFPLPFFRGEPVLRAEPPPARPH